MESKESPPPKLELGRGGLALRPGANSHGHAPAYTVAKNEDIFPAFVPEQHERIHRGKPPGEVDHRWASASHRCERASAEKMSSGSGAGSSNLLMRGKARVAAAAPASMASLARSKSSQANACTSGRRTRSAWRSQDSSWCFWAAATERATT